MKYNSSASTTIEDPSLIYYLETRFNFDSELLTSNTLFPGVFKNNSTSPTASIAPSPSTTSPVAWEYLFKEFYKSHTPENLIKFESELRSRQAPGLEYSDASSFIYDAILLLSQFYDKDVSLLNALLNLVAELTHHSRAKKYFPYIIVPRNVLLALSFATNASVDKGLSATFFALAMQLITSFDSKCLPVRLVYSLFSPKETFGGYYPSKPNGCTEIPRYVPCPIDSHPFSTLQKPFALTDSKEVNDYDDDGDGDDDNDAENKTDCDMNSDSSYISHLRRCLWLMTILHSNQLNKESSESQELWDLVMTEASHMSNKPGFKFGSLYECIPKVFSLFGSLETDCIVNQLKSNSHRPISIYEILAMYLEVFRIHPEVYHYMIKTAEYVKWAPESMVNFTPVMSIKNLPYQSANPRIRARTDLLFNGGAILPDSSSIAPSVASTTFFETMESQPCLDENELKDSKNLGSILPDLYSSSVNRMDSTKSYATHTTVATEETVTLSNLKKSAPVKPNCEYISSASSMNSGKSKRSLILDVVLDCDNKSPVNDVDNKKSSEMVKIPEVTVGIQSDVLVCDRNSVPINPDAAELLDTSTSNVTLVGSNNSKLTCTDKKQNGYMEKNEMKDNRQKKGSDSRTDTKKRKEKGKNSNESLNEFREYLKAPSKNDKKIQNSKDQTVREQSPSKGSQRRSRHHNKSGGKSTKSKSKHSKSKDILDGSSFFDNPHQSHAAEVDYAETIGNNSRGFLEKNSQISHLSKKFEMPNSPLESISSSNSVDSKNNSYSKNDSIDSSHNEKNGVLRHVTTGIVQLQSPGETQQTYHKAAVHITTEVSDISSVSDFVMIDSETAELIDLKDSNVEDIAQSEDTSYSIKLQRSLSRASKDDEMVLKKEEMAQIASVIERLESADGSIGSSDKEISQHVDGDGESFHSTQSQDGSPNAKLDKKEKFQKLILEKNEFDKSEKTLKIEMIEREINKAYRKTLESGESLLKTSHKSQRTLSEKLAQGHISSKYMAYKRVFSDDDIQKMQEDIKKNGLKEK